MVALVLLLRHYRWSVLFLLFAALLSSPYWWGAITPREGHGAFIWQYGLMMTNPIILEFLLGIIAAILYLRMNSKITWLSRALMLCAVGYFCFTCYTLYSPWQSMESGHLGGYSLACFMLLLAGLKYEKVRTRRFPSWLMFTGEISYSMYLLHMAVMFSSIYVLKSINSDNYFDTFNHRFDLLVITLIITYLLSYLSYIYIENKFSTYIKEKVLSISIRKK
ncbi:acyltransferase [Hafnia paralvei]|uniref:Acyltransferase n=1 Tax=Hafnia paralvei TaxID=546367 RepID=A0A4Q9EIK3_9GAMM|nr:acyltransferase [Hafnia paralvei]